MSSLMKIDEETGMLFKKETYCARCGAKINKKSLFWKYKGSTFSRYKYFCSAMCLTDYLWGNYRDD